MQTLLKHDTNLIVWDWEIASCSYSGKNVSDHFKTCSALRSNLEENVLS